MPRCYVLQQVWCKPTRGWSPWPVRCVESGHEFSIGGSGGSQVVAAFVELLLKVEVVLLELADALVESVDVDGGTEPGLAPGVFAERLGKPLLRRLDAGMTKAATAITRLIAAYQEELISLDELRTRMPELRARETSLRHQIDALDSQLADREVYLKLADNLENFLTGLRSKAATATRRRAPAGRPLARQGRARGPRQDHYPPLHPGSGPT